MWKEENILTLIFVLSMICHGMFFSREWLVLGLILSTGWLIFNRKSVLCFLHEALPGVRQGRGKAYKIFFDPRGIFFFMIAFSLLGLINPIRNVEGWLEAFRWLIFLLVYLWGKKMRDSEEKKKKILKQLVWTAFICTLISFLPGSEMIWLSSGPPEAGRFALFFGYPNAAAVFLGCLILIMQKEKQINLLFQCVFIIGLIYSGSRSATFILLVFIVILLIKKATMNFQDHKTADSLGFLGLNLRNASQDRKSLILILMLLLFWTLSPRFNFSLQHLMDWTDTSLNERIIYWLDSFRLAWSFHFLPQAGGWLAFPFIQTVPYWTLNPHSSFCNILLNQGLAGLLLLLIWSAKGLTGYIKELVWGKDLSVICTKSAALYLGLHSLVDTDMSFGVLGILFWLLIGMNSK